MVLPYRIYRISMQFINPNSSLPRLDHQLQKEGSCSLVLSAVSWALRTAPGTSTPSPSVNPAGFSGYAKYKLLSGWPELPPGLRVFFHSIMDTACKLRLTLLAFCLSSGPAQLSAEALWPGEPVL